MWGLWVQGEGVWGGEPPKRSLNMAVKWGLGEAPPPPQTPLFRAKPTPILG